jgi:hypothetical protein
VQDAYGGKPIIDVDGQPLYAELAVLRILNREGWAGVWADSCRHRYLVVGVGVPVSADIQKAGTTSLRQIAARMNDRSIPTALGRRWTAVQVKRVLQLTTSA